MLERNCVLPTRRAKSCQIGATTHLAFAIVVAARVEAAIKTGSTVSLLQATSTRSEAEHTPRSFASFLREASRAVLAAALALIGLICDGTNVSRAIQETMAGLPAAGASESCKMRSLEKALASFLKQEVSEKRIISCSVSGRGVSQALREAVAAGSPSCASRTHPRAHS